MKSQLVTLSKISGWTSVTLGAIHTLATVVVVQQAAQLDPRFRGTFLFMYMAAGLGCLLSGVVMCVSTSKELQNLRTAHHCFLISATFMLLLGIGAPIAMSRNPFGYISLASGVFAMTVTVLRYRNENGRN